MERSKRVEFLTTLVDEGTSLGSMDIWYKNERKTFPVFEIDLEYLIYNRYNGRIASLVKTHEIETGNQLDPTSSENVATIESFLWNSNESSNRSTEISIRKQGQLKYGIVTRDGVIIDGNRRAMILKRVYRDQSPVYFRGVILDETLDQNPKEIMRLETAFQMGEDAKVDYNPIEKYLKCKDMESYGFTNEEIGHSMGEQEPKIAEYLEIMELMDEYLDQLGYSGVYTRLDKTEDLFINLNKVYRRWQSTSGKVKWNFDESDLSDYKVICFDYIRYVYNSPKGIQAKDVREALTRNTETSYFAHKDIWKSFYDRHFDKVDPVTQSEIDIDTLREGSPDRSLSSLLKSRDESWAEQVDSAVKENFGLTREAIDNFQSKNEPLKLLRSALSKLQAVDIESEAFLNDQNVFNTVDEIRKTSDDYKKTIKVYKKSQ